MERAALLIQLVKVLLEEMVLMPVPIKELEVEVVVLEQ
tara:strand:- start:327 stop:440 length:114 start_codon:yes stop_codon:yes gene_type:complete